MESSNFWSASSSSPLFFESNDKKEPTVLNSSVPVRLAFLRKVYGILAVQLAMTTFISGSIMFMPALQGFIIENSWLLFANLFGNIIVMIALMYKRNEYPTNFYLLGGFTVLNSLSLGMIISQYDLLIVSQAFFLTGLIVVGLTMYTFQTKNDFSWLNGTLLSLLTALTVGGLLHIFFRNSALETLLTIGGAVLFSVYIIYDTQLIMKHLSPEEYVIGILNLYMDIINLFIKILRLLDSLKANQESSERRKKRRN